MDSFSEELTPAPTHPGELICGSHHIGDWNGVPLEFSVRMSFDGDMTVDLTDSDFKIRAIKVYDHLVMLNDTDPSTSIATVHELTPKEYYIVIEGAGGVQHGTIDIVIECTSNMLTPSIRASSMDPTWKAQHKYDSSHCSK